MTKILAKIADGEAGWELAFEGLHGLKGEETYSEVLHHFEKAVAVDFRALERKAPMISDLDPAITLAAEAAGFIPFDCNFHVGMNLGGSIPMYKPPDYLKISANVPVLSLQELSPRTM